MSGQIWYAMRGDLSGELISYRRAVMVWPDPNQLRRWFDGSTVTVVPVDLAQLGRPVMKVDEHPEWGVEKTGVAT